MSQDAVAIGTNQVAPVLVSFTLDNNGSIPSSSQLWANDELSPSGTTYSVSVLQSGGGVVWGAENLSVAGSSPVNLNNAVASVQNVTLANPVLQNPSAAQSITGFGLTLTSTTPLTVQSSITTTKYQAPTGGLVLIPSGLVADGTTDNLSAINAAISAAYTSGAGEVHIPCGQYFVSAAINFTNQSGLTLSGCGMGLWKSGTDSTSANNTTVLLGGGTGAVLDTTGSQYITIKNLIISSTTATIGIIQARDNNGGGGSANPFCFAQQNTFQNVAVSLSHTQASNSGFGSVGFYNVGGEGATYNNVLITSDHGYFFLTANDLSISSLYQTIQTGCPASMTEVKILGGAIRTLGNSPSSGIYTKSSDSFFISPDTEFLSANSNTAWGVTFGGGTVQAWDIRGQFENQTTNSIFQLAAGVSLDHINMDVVTSGQSGSGQYFTTITGGQTVTNSRLRVSYANGTQLPMFNNLSLTWKGGEIDLGTTATGTSYSNITLSDRTRVTTQGFTDAQVTFNSASVYDLGSDTGASTFNGGGQLKYPAAADTLVGKATTDIFTSKTIDSASNTVKINGNTISGGTVPVNRFTYSGVQPTCAVTGAGASGTCGVRGNSTDSLGSLAITVAGAGPAATGTVTLTFSSAFGANAGVCVMTPAATGTNSWNARASFQQNNTSTGTAVQNWDNNAAALTAGTYHLNYTCGGI